MDIYERTGAPTRTSTWTHQSLANAGFYLLIQDKKIVSRG